MSGSSLGLKFVKKIAHMSGGCVAVDSEGPNRGSIFAFSMKMGHMLVSCLPDESKDTNINALSDLLIMDDTEYSYHMNQ